MWVNPGHSCPHNPGHRILSPYSFQGSFMAFLDELCHFRTWKSDGNAQSRLLISLSWGHTSLSLVCQGTFYWDKSIKGSPKARPLLFLWTFYMGSGADELFKDSCSTMTWGASERGLHAVPSAFPPMGRLESSSQVYLFRTCQSSPVATSTLCLAMGKLHDLLDWLFSFVTLWSPWNGND